MRTKGISLEHTKRSNRLLVLRLLCSGAGFSRTEITKKVGLAKMTVTNITSELLRAGLIEETVSQHAGAGRPQMRLELTQQAPAVVGLFLNRDSCTGIAATMDLNVLSRAQYPLGPEDTADSLLDKLEMAARQLVASCGREEILGVGIAAMGPLNSEMGRLLDPPNFYGIQNLDLTDTLSQRLGLPMFLANDMDAAALAEKLYGRGRALRNFVYVGLTNGVGAGLILNDSLFRGKQGFAGELGHMTIDCDGPLCTCGKRGCLETYVSVPKMLTLFRKEFGVDFSCFRDLCLFCEKDPSGAFLLDTLLEKLSVALVNLCNLTDPEAVIIGHDGASLTDAQLATVAERVNRSILARSSARIPLLRSSFGTQASLYGAAVLPLKSVFNGDLCYERFFGADSAAI